MRESYLTPGRSRFILAGSGLLAGGGTRSAQRESGSLNMLTGVSAARKCCPRKSGDKMDKPHIAVITPTLPRRSSLLLSRCIPSVMAQDYAGKVDQIVISDGYN